jgi:hypothetical protein
MIILVAWDVVAYVYGGGDATISVIITDWSYYTPWVPFIVGNLTGHFFFPAKKSVD